MKNLFKWLVSWFSSKEPVSCEFADYCQCIPSKSLSCYNCKWYFWLDSAYGICRTLPTAIEVAWCKDVCSLFEQKEST